MTDVIITIICIYFVVSIFVGIADIARITKQEEELSSFPRGDIGVNIFPRKILGIHNLIFFPCFLVLGIVWLVNTIIDN